MNFNCSTGNPQQNFFLDRACSGSFDSIMAIRPSGFAGEEINFIHEYGKKLCLYSGSSLQVYSPDLSSNILLGALPPGNSVLFSPECVWITHDGPLRKYDSNLKVVGEEYVVPHGGPWTTCLGLYIHQSTLAMAFSFSGGPRERAPEFQLNLATVNPAASVPPISIRSKFSRPGDVESVCLLGDRLFTAGEQGLGVFSLDGKLISEVPMPEGILHLASSDAKNVVGGFCRIDGRWLYREFDANGKEIFSVALVGATSPGYVVFDPEGSRFIMSQKRLAKYGLDGQRIWSQSLRKDEGKAPRFLVYREGRCAFMDGADFVLLEPDGTESYRIFLPVKKITSPPYLDGNGNFWLGLAKQSEKLLKVSFAD